MTNTRKTLGIVGILAMCYMLLVALLWQGGESFFTAAFFPIVLPIAILFFMVPILGLGAGEGY